MTWYYNAHPDLFFLAGGGDKGFDVYAGKQIGFEEAVGRISGFIFHDVDLLPLNETNTYSCSKVTLEYNVNGN